MGVSNRVRVAAFDAFLEGRSRDSPLLSHRALAYSNTRIKLSDSTFHSDFTGIHFEHVVVGKKNTLIIGDAKWLRGRELYVVEKPGLPSA